MEALKLDDDFHKITLPIEPLPGEDSEEAMIRWFIEKGILIPVGEKGVLIDEEKANAFDPNLGKVLHAMILAETDTALNQLEQEGLIYSSVDENGELIYFLTDAGKQYQESLRGWFAE